jgi:pyruvate dehydrogenase E2 component (dihydrolipoamide acetyltransferase)
MAVEITIPRLGWSMEEGVFSQWLKKDGETVREGDPLFELESDKAVQPVESFDAGILSIPSDCPKPGDVVKVGQTIGYLYGKGETPAVPGCTTVSIVPDKASLDVSSTNCAEMNLGAEDFTPRERNALADHPPASPSVRRLARKMGVDVHSLGRNNAVARITSDDVLAVQQATNGKKPHPIDEASDATSSPPVSPRAARRAVRLGVNLADVKPTGSSGRIRERDVLTAAASSATANGVIDAPSVGPEVHPPSENPKAQFDSEVRGEAPSAMRRTIASRMLAAAQDTASVTIHASAEATELVRLRRQYKAKFEGAGLRVPGFTDLLVKLTSVALEKHPVIIGQWTEKAIMSPHGIHIAIAVDTPAGLMTPVLRNVTELSLTEVSSRLHDLVQRTRSRRATSDELQGGVFTISNLGSYRVDGFTPLLNLPQTAILGMGRISAQPVVVEERVEVRDRMTLSLTFDHRVVDGAAAAAFLTTVCELCESPLPFLLS